MQNVTPLAITALVLELIPAIGFGLAANPIARKIQRWPATVRILAPAVFVVPYVIIGASYQIFRWNWFALYALLPVIVAWLLSQAAKADFEQRGNWRDALILLTLGLAVDLLWFASAWPTGLAPLNELLLVDIGLYGFLAIRQLSGVGFNFYLQWSDWKTGLRELLFFAPIVLLLGWALGFIHPHAAHSFKILPLPAIWSFPVTWLGIFCFTALPEELFFRAWVQNLLERRIGRKAALIVASIVFGLSHFNKRNPIGRHFNLPYVILATIAGIFYGRAWRENRRVPASTITHATVDWLWSWWF
jgi:uncharacterized protein